jgi:ankyrin repeat protein
MTETSRFEDISDASILSMLQTLSSWSDLKNVCNSVKSVREVCIAHKDVIMAHIFYNKYNTDVLLQEAYWDQGDNTNMLKTLIELNVNIRVNHNAPIVRAAENGYINSLRMLHDAGADIHVSNDLPLKRAARGGHLPVVIYLLKQGANTHENDEINNIMIQAVLSRNVELVQYLHQVVGMDIRTDEDICLVWAATQGDVEMTAYLLENGGNPDAQNSSPLLLAVEGGSLGVVNVLLAHDANVNGADDQATVEASTQTNDILSRILQAGGDPNAQGGVPLINAIEERLSDNVRTLVNAGAVITNRSIRMAVRVGDLEILRWLHIQGGNLNQQSLLQIAAENDHRDVTEYLTTMRTMNNNYDIHREM